jgi:xylan 1,4-beta-xylosidase
MKQDYLSMARTVARVDASLAAEPFEPWRHGIGLGGVTHEPLPDGPVKALGKLKPRLVRIFLQEYFSVYPDHGVFDWSRLDPYMDALAGMGCKVLATVNLKPPVLYPRIDETAWLPNNAEEYQDVIRALVKRYSVDRRIVTHWEHANETDIGENGGCPFLITTAEENHSFYKMLIKPVLEVFPEAKVGGPAIADSGSPILKGFIRLCHDEKTPLHFVSWHSYNNDCRAFARQIESVRGMISIFDEAQRPELMINEMNKGFDFQDTEHPSYHLLSVEEQAHQPVRAAFLAANLIAMTDARLDWSHYYHAWDSSMRPVEFARFFSPSGVREVMYRHWNESPHRFGLFSDDGRIRPQYFVYSLLKKMEGDRVSCIVESGGISSLATRREGQVAVLLANYGPAANSNRIVILQFSGLKPGMKRMTLFRIDGDRLWDERELELKPVESRRVHVMPEFQCQAFCPENSVVAVLLQDIDGYDV